MTSNNLSFPRVVSPFVLYQNTNRHVRRDHFSVTVMTVESVGRSVGPPWIAVSASGNDPDTPPIIEGQGKKAQIGWYFGTVWKPCADGAVFMKICAKNNDLPLSNKDCV